MFELKEVTNDKKQNLLRAKWIFPLVCFHFIPLMGINS
jgi:hypothetical protein